MKRLTLFAALFAMLLAAPLMAQEASDAQAPADPYNKGTKYPPQAGVSIEAFSVPVGATEVHVPVTLDRESPNTVIAHIRVFDGKGGRADPDKKRALIFRPGDPLTQTVTFKVKNMNAGNTVRAVQYEVPDGAKRNGGGILITAEEGAVNEPITGGREPKSFSPTGELVYDVTGETIQFDDKGGPGSFSTALSHGRTQVGNQETGFYGQVNYGGFKRTPEGLMLDTRRLDEPVTHGQPSVDYPFLAAMLSGHKTPETHFKYGSVEWVAKMPNRRGSWPALWLLPTSGWPPEIDVYEGFGYNGSWEFKSDLSTNIHGGRNLQRTFTRPAMNMRMEDFGLPNTLDSEFHAFAVTVDPEWITLFVDGVETMQYANPFQGKKWYPLTNVAVKAKTDAAYDDGSGAMTLKSLKIWRAE
ncbi:MAG: family 16 glycosylhydrolase [Phycisphaerae bacterium]